MARSVAVPVSLLVCLLGILSILAVFRPSTLTNEPLHRLTTPLSSHRNVVAGDYLLGVGKADITGPVVEINMMGYADSDQSGTGLRQRIYCRAFIIGDISVPENRVVYLVLDTQSGDTAIRRGILDALAQKGAEYKIYTKDNIAVTGTHSHSGPGAWLNYLLPQITSKGFSKESYQAIVDGSVLAIQRAHKSLTPGNLRFGKSQLQSANINRSPYSYIQNPQSERSQYKDDVDKEFSLLEFKRGSDGLSLGALTWFPVHGTSLYQNNTLITGDNKGVAAYLLEESMKKSNPNFVAGFSQSNVGDTSPNTLGPFCQDTGLPCKFDDSTCGGKTQGCHGRGPKFMFQDQGTKSCYEIGSRQFEAASKLLASTDLEKVPASTISSFHTYVNLSSFSFNSPFDPTRRVTTCSAALGYGFAGGTTDGPGAFDFQQGTNDTDDDSPSLKNPLWKVARSFIHHPSDEQIACQRPKPILLDVGATTAPYAWSPNIVDIQLLRVGSLIMIIVPGEATTMSGRRWKSALAKAAPGALGIVNPKVVLGGPANTYAHYIATEEEYGVQRYEGASTLYGKHTLAAYVNLTLTYLPYLDTKDKVKSLKPLKPGPSPPINTENSLSFISPVVVDTPQIFKRFGDALESPDSSRKFLPGNIVAARFVGTNPRNNFRLEGTFAAVEKLVAGKWTQVRSDRDWFLVYKWKRINTVLGTSEVRIEWEIEPKTEAGQYRIKYYGDAKSLGGGITAFEGTSGTFNVGAVTKSMKFSAGGGELIRP